MIPAFFVSLSLIIQTDETYDEEKRNPKNDTKKKTKFNSAAERAKPLLNAEFVFQPSVFPPSGKDIEFDEFPKCDFLNPKEAQRLLGDYKIDVTFYTKEYEIVEKPTDSGRYGAVVKITAEDGHEYVRFRTLYKTKHRMTLSFNNPLDGELMFPSAIGVEELIWHNQRQSVNDYVGLAIERDIQRSHDFAILLAGVSEMSPRQEAVSQLENAITKDRQWWLKLKRKLNGNAKRFAKLTPAPLSINGLNAPVLREGTEEEAGMKPRTVKKINGILEEWANDSDQPFNVCIARRSIVFLNQGYGFRNGHPITADTKHLVFSITKALSGCLLMMFIDRGIISLNDPVGKILPEFDDKGIETPVTFHHLFTHTADMDGHFTDTWNDLEHAYGEAYPYLSIGKQHRYNGTSIGIGLKALEQLTGLTLPHLYQKCLFGPLGCESIESIDGSAMTWSNAFDLAHVGQMLANHGAYGDLRFFSQDTFQQMLPQKLDKLLEPDTDVTWGIGLTKFEENGLSTQTIGHGSASSCTLRVDLEKDLVITMTRLTAGKDFQEYHPKFIAAITNSLAN